MKVIYDRRAAHFHPDEQAPVRRTEKLWIAIFFALLAVFLLTPAHAAVGDPHEIDLGTFLIGCGLVGLGAWLFFGR